MLYNQRCGFYGCELDHKEDAHILSVIANMGIRHCCDHGAKYPEFNADTVGICGETEYGDTCACGCDATGWRCGISESTEPKLPWPTTKI